MAANAPSATRASLFSVIPGLSRGPAPSLGEFSPDSNDCKIHFREEKNWELGSVLTIDANQITLSAKKIGDVRPRSHF